MSTDFIVNADGMRDYVKWHEATTTPPRIFPGGSARYRPIFAPRWTRWMGSARCSACARAMAGTYCRYWPNATTPRGSRPRCSSCTRSWRSERGTSRPRQAWRTSPCAPSMLGIRQAYVGAVPADLVIMIGIFGNISDDDVRRTIMTAPQLAELARRCCGHAPPALRTGIAWFVACYQLPVSSSLTTVSLIGEEERAALGSARYGGPPQPLITGQQLFTFVG